MTVWLWKWKEKVVKDAQILGLLKTIQFNVVELSDGMECSVRIYFYEVCRAWRFSDLWWQGMKSITAFQQRPRLPRADRARTGRDANRLLQTWGPPIGYWDPGLLSKVWGLPAHSPPSLFHAGSVPHSGLMAPTPLRGSFLPHTGHYIHVIACMATLDLASALLRTQMLTQGLHHYCYWEIIIMWYLVKKEDTKH